MKISIITPTYNRKNFLIEAIKSVEAIRMEPLENVTFEYIVYDDGSTDGTNELFKTGPKKNIKYIRNEKNYGQSYAKNKAVLEATGEYIFFLDSDDIILSRALHNFAILAVKNPDAAWFVSDFIRVDDSLHYIIGEDYFGWNFSDTDEMLKAIFKGEHFIQGNAFFKKQLFVDVGMFDEKLRMAEDLDLYVRFLLKAGLPVRANFISHLHRFHSENISRDIDLKKHKTDALRLMEKYLKSN